MTPRTPVLIELPAADDAAERLLALYASDPDFYPAFLDSAASGGELGRFSLLLAAPGSRLQLDRLGRLAGPGFGEGFCARLNAWWREERGPPPPAPWPFAGGWFLYLGYELAGEIEPTLELPESPLEPVACAVRISAAILIDHQTGGCVAIGEAGAAAAVQRLAADFAACGPLPP